MPRDEKFESISLQRGVSCEPDFRRASFDYRFGLSAKLRTRFTKDWDIRNVRAMAAGLTPALNDAMIRFALPSGISSISLIFLLRNAADWPRDDVPVAAAIAVSLLGLL